MIYLISYRLKNKYFQGIVLFFLSWLIEKDNTYDLWLGYSCEGWKTRGKYPTVGELINFISWSFEELFCEGFSFIFFTWIPVRVALLGAPGKEKPRGKILTMINLISYGLKTNILKDSALSWSKCYLYILPHLSVHSRLKP